MSWLMAIFLVPLALWLGHLIGCLIYAILRAACAIVRL